MRAVQALVDLELAHLQDMVMQPGIARAPYMNEHLESLADDHSTNDDEKIGIDTAGMGFSLAADLHLLAGGGVFVGQFDSETGRIAYLRMAARLGLAPPFWHYQSTKERARAWHPFTRRPRMWAEV